MKIQINELIAEMEKILQTLENIEKIYREKSPWLFTGEKCIEKAVLLADIFVNYYTCSETLFFRISQFFENSLPEEKWHAELLRKMTLSITNVRPSVISNEVFLILDELRKFRHFKRYYFSMDYDWDKLDYLRKKFDKLHPLLKNDLENFKDFLNELIK